MIKFIKNAFNKAAQHYDTSCQLQLKTGEVLIDLLKNHCINSHTILDAGCGTGIVTQKLASAFHYNTFYAIDLADQLLAKAKEKLNGLNIHVEPIDYNHVDRIPILFDMIYANLSFHWSSDFDKTLSSMRDKLKENGVLAFSVPLDGTFQEIKDYFSINKFHGLPFIEKQLANAEFAIIHAESQTITFEFDHVLQAIKSIKSVGAHYVANRNKFCFTKLRKYLQNTEPFKLSYHIGYFIIKKS